LETPTLIYEAWEGGASPNLLSKKK